MTTAALRRPAAPPSDTPPTSAELDLQALRAEIDGVDDAILQLLERRRGLTARIGRVKADGEPCLRLKPDREDAVLQRLAARVDPSMRTMTRAIWREIMSAGLAEQERLKVLVWTGEHAPHLMMDARHRFGAHPDYQLVDTPEAALAAASEGSAVAVLATDGDWWTELAEAHPHLWAFEMMRRPGTGEALALAVGRVDPASLAPGPVLRAVRGGDADASLRPNARLHAAGGWMLRAESEGVPVTDEARHAGVIGRAAALPWRPQV